MKPQWLDRDTIECDQCKIPTPLADMSFRKRDGYGTSCKQCVSAAQRASRQGQEMTWAYRLSKIKSRAKKIGAPCNIDEEDLARLWEIQGGKCVYTEQEMVNAHGERNNPLTVSVDRIDFSRGYVKDNIVLCTLRANAMKNDMSNEEFKEWMPHWYTRLMQLRSKL